ncbi:MAG: dsDNA nuclease domain-containing protein [Clostridiaceae bacterium]|nr:dsDNA nuclease domain-containing protein [Clostridiaceae bacterium]
MSLDSIITSTHKEIAGSRTKNRLTVQISYAIQLIMEFYSTDFLIMMDYIEDVSVIRDPSRPSAIHLYQVKTKSSDKQYLLSTVIGDEWFQKLYANAQKYKDFLSSASVVCNTDIVASVTKSGTEIFPNAKTSLDDKTIQLNIKKIRTAIALDQKIKENDVDLSRFYFVRSTLSTKGHKEEVEHQFQDFLLEQATDLQVATAKSIFDLLYDELDKRFNQEISENCTDINEIFDKKGLGGRNIKAMISCGLAIQVPTLDKLFSDFKITSVSECRKYTSQYTQIKMDMYSNMSVFVQLKRTVFDLIETANTSGIDDMLGILDVVYSQSIESQLVPDVYKNEHYLKMLIMILIYKYCYGGENT